MFSYYTFASLHFSAWLSKSVREDDKAMKTPRNQGRRRRVPPFEENMCVSALKLKGRTGPRGLFYIRAARSFAPPRRPYVFSAKIAFSTGKKTYFGRFPGKSKTAITAKCNMQLSLETAHSSRKWRSFFVASCNPRYILESKNERVFAFSMHREIVAGWRDLLSHTYPEIEHAFF